MPWILSIDPAESHDVLERTLVHELAHIYTLDEADLTLAARQLRRHADRNRLRPHRIACWPTTRNSFWAGVAEPAHVLVGQFVRDPVRGRQRARGPGRDLHGVGLRRQGRLERDRGEVPLVRRATTPSSPPRPRSRPSSQLVAYGPARVGAEVPMDRVARDPPITRTVSSPRTPHHRLRPWRRRFTRRVRRARLRTRLTGMILLPLVAVVLLSYRRPSSIA